MLIRAVYNAVLDALFPVSETERQLAVLSPESAYDALLKAPPYAGLTVPLEKTRSVLAYKDERVSRMVWCIKYKRSAHAVRLGGYALWKALTESGCPTAPATGSQAMIIPLPIASRRRRERGFNQCELMADEIGRLDKVGRFDIEKGLLLRVRHGSTQKLNDRGERLRSAKGVFSVDGRVAARLLGTNGSADAPLIVIDDVITTGSTMKEAMDTLRAAGFKDVRGLSLAH